MGSSHDSILPDIQAIFDDFSNTPQTIRATLEQVPQDEQLHFTRSLLQHAHHTILPFLNLLDGYAYLYPVLDGILSWVQAQPNNFQQSLDQDQLHDIRHARTTLSKTAAEMGRAIRRIHNQAAFGWSTFPDEIPRAWLNARDRAHLPTIQLFAKHTLSMIAQIAELEITQDEFLRQAREHQRFRRQNNRQWFLTGGVAREIFEQIRSEIRQTVEDVGEGEAQPGTPTGANPGLPTPPATGPSRRLQSRDTRPVGGTEAEAEAEATSSRPSPLPSRRLRERDSRVEQTGLDDNDANGSGEPPLQEQRRVNTGEGAGAVADSDAGSSEIDLMGEVQENNLGQFDHSDTDSSGSGSGDERPPAETRRPPFQPSEFITMTRQDKINLGLMEATHFANYSQLDRMRCDLETVLDANPPTADIVINGDPAHWGYHSRRLPRHLADTLLRDLRRVSAEYRTFSIKAIEGFMRAGLRVQVFQLGDLDRIMLVFGYTRVGAAASSPSDRRRSSSSSSSRGGSYLARLTAHITKRNTATVIVGIAGTAVLLDMYTRHKIHTDRDTHRRVYYNPPRLKFGEAIGVPVPAADELRAVVARLLVRVGLRALPAPMLKPVSPWLCGRVGGWFCL